MKSYIGLCDRLVGWSVVCRMPRSATVEMRLPSLFSQQLKALVTAHCGVSWSLSRTAAASSQLILQRWSQQPALSDDSVQVCESPHCHTILFIFMSLHFLYRCVSPHCLYSCMSPHCHTFL